MPNCAWSGIDLDVVHTLQRANVVTVKDDLTLQLVPILLDMIVLDHQ